jgi:hypothetical protein
MVAAANDQLNSTRARDFPILLERRLSAGFVKAKSVTSKRSNRIPFMFLRRTIVAQLHARDTISVHEVSKAAANWN